MTSVAMLALILYIVGMLGLFTQAVIARSPGWAGGGLIALAWLLTNFPS